MEQFRYEVRNTVVSQNKTFREKFDWKPDIPIVEKQIDVVNGEQQEDTRKEFEDDAIAASKLMNQKVRSYRVLRRGLNNTGINGYCRPTKGRQVGMH